MNLRQKIEKNQKMLLFAVIGLLLLFSLWGQRPLPANSEDMQLTTARPGSTPNSTDLSATLEDSNRCERAFFKRVFRKKT